MRRVVLLALLAAVTLAAATACHKRLSYPPPAPARVELETPPPAPPPPPEQPAPEPDEYSRLRAMDLDAINRLGLFADIHFDYDQAVVLDRDQPILSAAASRLREFDFLNVAVEGHCDERGTVEYNLALGERRAKATREYLVALGVPAARLRIASYGKESPICENHNETCWSQNRRAHLLVSGKVSE